MVHLYRLQLFSVLFSNYNWPKPKIVKYKQSSLLTCKGIDSLIRSINTYSFYLVSKLLFLLLNVFLVVRCIEQLRSALGCTHRSLGAPKFVFFTYYVVFIDYYFFLSLRSLIAKIKSNRRFDCSNACYCLTYKFNYTKFIINSLARTMGLEQMCKFNLVLSLLSCLLFVFANLWQVMANNTKRIGVCLLLKRLQGLNLQV